MAPATCTQTTDLGVPRPASSSLLKSQRVLTLRPRSPAARSSAPQLWDFRAHHPFVRTLPLGGRPCCQAWASGTSGWMGGVWEVVWSPRPFLCQCVSALPCVLWGRSLPVSFLTSPCSSTRPRHALLSNEYQASGVRGSQGQPCLAQEVCPQSVWNTCVTLMTWQCPAHYGR